MLCVALDLSFIEIRPNALDVLVPVALDFVPMAFRLLRSLLSVGPNLSSSIVGALARRRDLDSQFGLVLGGRCCDVVLSSVHLLPELREPIRRCHDCLRSVALLRRLRPTGWETDGDGSRGRASVSHTVSV